MMNRPVPSNGRKKAGTAIFSIFVRVASTYISNSLSGYGRRVKWAESPATWSPANVSTNSFNIGSVRRVRQLSLKPLRSGNLWLSKYVSAHEHAPKEPAPCRVKALLRIGNPQTQSDVSAKSRIRSKLLVSPRGHGAFSESSGFCAEVWQVTHDLPKPK